MSVYSQLCPSISSRKKQIWSRIYKNKYYVGVITIMSEYLQ